MDFLEFYKDLHYREVSRKDYLSDTAINIPVTITSGVIVALFYLTTSFSYSESPTLKVLFLQLTVATACLSFAVMFFLIKVYTGINKGYAYTENPQPKDLDKYYRELLDYHEDKAEALEKFKTYLTGKYRDYSDHNTRNNDAKAKNLYYTRRCLVFTLISLSLTAGIYIINFILKADDAQKVQIINWPEVRQTTTFTPSGYERKRQIKPETSANSTERPADAGEAGTGQATPNKEAEAIENKTIKPIIYERKE